MFNLIYLDRFKVEDKDAGLTEPSGLVLSHERDGLWTVSDDTERVFYLTLDGELERRRSFDVPYNGLEGLTIDPTGSHLFAVREETNLVIKVHLDEQTVADERRLAQMEGYDAIAPLFADSPENKGLEGIAWNVDSGTLFALKEGEPGLLIELDPDLIAIRSHVILDRRNGFLDPGTSDGKVDYSGICYDPTRRAFWIVSDKARRVFLFDRDGNRVLHSAPLGFGKDGDYREVEKAEGVAYDPNTGRLYVISDEEKRLYLFAVRK